MTDALDLLAAPTTDEPIAAGLMFAAGAVVAIGGTLLAGHAMREYLRRKEAEKELSGEKLAWRLASV